MLSCNNKTTLHNLREEDMKENSEVSYQIVYDVWMLVNTFLEILNLVIFTFKSHRKKILLHIV